MKGLSYLKERGIARTMQVLWQYKLDAALQKAMAFLLRPLPLTDTIVIESHNDFDSNGGAFYEFLRENGYLARYRVVWLLKNKKPAGRLPKNVRCAPLHGPGLRKSWYLCRAKYLCFDNEIFTKLRPGQVSLFCDHGAVALKSVRGVYNVAKDVDYVLSPSENYTPVLAREYELEGTEACFLPIGYPYHDVLFRQTPDEVKKLTDREYRKVFLWMPTFRKGGGYGRNDSTEEQPFGVPLLRTEEEYGALQDFLARHDCLLIIKIHPMQDPDTLKRLRETENIRVLTGSTVKKLGVDNYRLIKSASALISDYSSIAFSFLLLDRPLAFVLSDLASYQRGFAMENPEDFLVGEQIRDFPAFYAFLESVLEGRDDWRARRQALCRWLYRDRDGGSCQRLADALGLEK